MLWIGSNLLPQGGSGKGAGDGARPHLHFEVDRSTDNPLSTPTEGGVVDTTIDPLDILYKKADQIVAPDCVPDIGASATDSAGRPWYNIKKIEAVPTI